ncbi:hypothetical protein [Leifsonia sp. 71-9]|uniref:hypothetical protein n=1 Tax=Leifsonia sp. 71-9 TaxID=1895934 RepID=UPI00092B2DF0|nr:hypothetical protein [Leifsonia sp. 71-9]OJX72806.1 MAG: hypothetical protein BGO91_13630 [Leifsonia sp. 71-9]
MALIELTKAQLVTKVREAQDREAQMRTERDAWKEQVKATPTPTAVPEADALAGCIRALAGVPNVRADSYGSSPERPDTKLIRRVLLSLADRYGVDLIQHEVAPCDRVHLDDAGPALIADAFARMVSR